MGLQFKRMKKVSIVIPNYNGIKYLGNCLASLEISHEYIYKVLVVDNGSTDGSDKIAKEYGAELIELGENTGFTGAVNAGIKSSSDCDYVILLNNDTVAGKNFVRELVAGIEKHEDAFSCQAMMLRMDDPRLLDDGGDTYNALGWARARGKDKPASLYNTDAEIFHSCGGAAIYKKQVLDELGGFDDKFFAYLEDLDIGWRARRLGYKNYYAPKAKVMHAGSAFSGSRYNEFKVSHSSRNSVYVIRKNMPKKYIAMLSPLLFAGFAIKTLFFAVKGLGRTYIAGLVEGFRMKTDVLATENKFDAKIARMMVKQMFACDK